LPDLVALTKAYGLLHEKVLSLAAERRVEVSLEEQRTLATHVHAAIARAAEAAARRSAWELHHQAHQLRNPLGSALMALTVLRGRADLGENARLVEMAERNLKRIEGMIDESVSAGEGRAAAQ
jgi:signal transduction histidine kinase